MTRNRLLFFIVHVLAPITVGGLIYIRWRDSNLVMFQWFRRLGLDAPIAWLRTGAGPVSEGWPFWLVYSLPDGLWVYALTALMILLWRDAVSSARFVWLSLGLLLGAGSELGQLAGIVPGSFDVIDLLVCVFAAAAALAFTSRKFNLQKLRFQGA
ncbi:MAG TPA: hypothetical protein VJT71_13895 [Pyrinomonadaceae bacterium]|nr:hypothetical protein [Pyrinomonadaceae bacterium]